MANERKRRTSAKQLVLEYLLREGRATNIELNKLCFRYGARILELRRDGNNIVTIPQGGGVFLYELRYPLNGG